MSIRAPIFPSVMISAGTIPVPILFAPKTGVESPLLTVQPDTFTRAGEVLASGTAPGRAPAQRLRKSRRSAPAAEPPVRNGSRLVDLEKRFELARKSRASGDLESARAHYEAALESLDSPFDPAAGRSNPMRLEIEGGRDLFAEALFESCVLSLADRAPIVLRRLHRFLSDPEKNIDPTALERAKARTLQAYAIMQHTSSTFESRGDLLEKGLCMIDRVMNSLRGEPESRAKNDAVDAYARMKATKELKAVHQFTRATLQLKKALERLDSEKNPHERNGGLAGLMRRLKREHVPPAQGENSYTAQFLKGFTLIRLGMYASAPRLHLMQRAMALLDQAKKEIDPASAPHAADAHFSMQLLRAEILARKLVLAHGRREAPARKKLAKELGDLFASIAADHSRDERKDLGPKYAGTLPIEYKNRLIASYQADAAILMAKLGMWNDAIFWARAVTTGQFESTPASSRLLTEEIFDRFIVNNSFLSDEQIRSRLKDGSWMKRLHAAVRQQHSMGAMQSLACGMIGMLPGLGVYLFADLKTPALCMAGVLASTAINRLKNGWMTEEAQYAAITDKYERTPKETAKDLWRLGVHSSFDSLPWVFPSAFLEFQGQGIEVLGNTFSRSLDVAGEKIGNFGHVIANPDAVMQSINSLSHESIPSAGDLLRSFRDAMAGVSAALFASNIVWPEILKFFRQDRRWLWLAPGFALFNLDLATMPGFDGWHFLEHAYTYGAAAVFLMQMRRDMTPAHKEHLNYASMAFLPGAFMLSADIGCWLAPGPNDPTYAERLIRAGLLTVESYFMMKILGNVKWHWDHRETAATNVLTLMKQTFSANAALPLSMVIVNAFTAPLGGYIQRDKTLDNVVLIALQGVATTVCMLPITLGISGVLKQTIPILTRAKEGLDDSRAAGDGSMKRAYHTLVGGVSAFNTTYAHNRIFRSGYWDIIPALFRTLMGWDTFAGQLAMSGTNIVHGNGVSTRMWPELSGTTWSRQSVKKEFENATDKRLQIDQRMANKTLSPEDARWERGMVHAQIRTFFQEAAQVMHPAHLFMSHEALTDRLIPFYSFTMAARPPTFPQLPDRHFLADFYLMLHGGHPNERLDLEEFITLLDYVKADASDPSAYDTVRPLVQLLALARDNMDPEYRKLIEDFFAENPEVPLMVNVELAEHPPLHEKYRRIARKKVRGKVRMEFKDYERRVNGHNRQKRAHDKLEGLFLF